MATAVAAAPLAGLPSSCVMDARDVQHRVERLMADQAANGVLYLKGGCVPQEALARAGLRAAGPDFCLAGTARITTQMASDGPTLYVVFSVPETLGYQTQQYNPATGRYEATNASEGAWKLQAAALSVTFPAHEAYERLMVQASPMRPAINKA